MKRTQLYFEDAVWSHCSAALSFHASRLHDRQETVRRHREEIGRIAGAYLKVALTS
jgi:hypothetical protein